MWTIWDAPYHVLLPHRVTGPVTCCGADPEMVMPGCRTFQYYVRYAKGGISGLWCEDCVNSPELGLALLRSLQ